MRARPVSPSFRPVRLLLLTAGLVGAMAGLSPAQTAIIIDHRNTKLSDVPEQWVNAAKSQLHIAYGHTSHGSQIVDGMSGLVDFKGPLYAWNDGGTGGALDLRDAPFANAYDLGNPNRTAWAAATRQYLNAHTDVNVIIWSWCGEVSGASEAEIDTYLSLMNQLEADFPRVKFVYMTGHLDGSGLEGSLHQNNERIRAYCRDHNKTLFDFADIETYDPDGVWYGDKYPTDACSYDSNGDGVQDRNWAQDWQSSHTEGVDWYMCGSAHSEPLNANRKAYAAWSLWARLAGWSGDTVPALRMADAQGVEGTASDGTVRLTASLAPAGATNVTVEYATAPGTATAGVDYLATSGTLTFEPGTTSATITVTVIGDTEVEGNETFLVNLTNAVGATIARGQAVGTIIDDDPTPQLAFSAPTFSVGEGAGQATITVTRSGATTIPVTVDYATSGGSAMPAADYTATSGSLTFGVGETSKTFTVAIVNDTIVEPAETVELTLANAGGGADLGAQTSAVLTIADNDLGGTLAFSSAAYSVGEGGGQATITVVRTGGAASGVTVTYQTNDGSATAGLDYEGRSGTLTFGAGQASATFTIPITNDTLAEGNETVNLELVTAGGGGTLGSLHEAVLTIVDNDSGGALSFSAPSVSVSEGAAQVTLTVARAGGLASDVLVDFATSDLTAQAGTDYGATEGTLSFGAGQTSASVTVPILQDELGEGDETFQVTLSNARGRATLGTRPSATVLIKDDERVVSFTSASFKVSEAASQAQITIKRLGLLTGSLSVDYVTSDGTAVAGTDYQGRTGTLTFGPNVASKTFTIPIINDTQVEGSETVLLRLKNPVGGVLGPLQSAVLTITDDDQGGVIQLGAATYSILESKGPLKVTVVRSSGAASGVSVSFAATAGTASAGSDFTPVSGILSFASGQTVQTVSVPIVNDTEAEGAETVLIALSDPTGGATLGPRASAVATILDDEAVVELGAAAVTVNEGGVAQVPVRRSGNAAGTVTVSYATSDGDALAGTDYRAQNGTLTFGPGVVSRALAVATIDDTLSEPSKSFTLTLGPAVAGAALGHQASALVTIKDSDAGGVIQFSQASFAVSEKTPLATVTVARAQGAASGVTVRYATADDTAVAGQDYDTQSGTLSFGAGVVSRTFTVPILNDTENRGSRSVNLILSEATGGASLGRSSAKLTIADDDGPSFQMGQAALRVAEGAGQVAVVVRRAGNLQQAATVEYATSDDSATAGGDYLAVSGTLTFPAGAATKSFSISIVNDTLAEPDETFKVTLRNPSAGNGIGSPGTAVVTIADDDQGGVLQFGAPVVSLMEPADGTTSLATITVTRTGGLAGEVTVHYTTGGGTATAGEDYVATSGSLSFAAGQTSATFTVPVMGDSVEEGNEKVVLALSDPTGRASVGVQGTADLWIVEPKGAVKLVFIHHSTGENWLSDTQGQLGLVLRDNNYFVSDTNYGWGPAYPTGDPATSDGTTIGDHTDLGNWYDWFRSGASATYLAALYTESGQHAGYSRLADPDPARENEIVLFKSCFPNSSLSGDPGDAPPPIADNPLKSQDASSSAMTVANAKGIYQDLLGYFAAHPEKLFVAVTAPPLVSSATSPEQAANARAFNDWLVTEWLSSYGGRNVAVLDFFDVLTSNGGSVSVNDVGRATGNHHRVWDGAVQHVHPVASDVSAYGTNAGDSHPTAAGGKKASAELVALLNLAYNRWKGLDASGDASLLAAPGARLSPAALAPPGRAVADEGK